MIVPYSLEALLQSDVSSIEKTDCKDGKDGKDGKDDHLMTTIRNSFFLCQDE